MPTAKTWVVGGTIVALVVFSGVQTYRVHEMSVRLASPSLTPASVPISVDNDKPKDETLPAEVKATKDAKAETEGEKVAEDVLKRQRERLRKDLANTGGKTEGGEGQSSGNVSAAKDAAAKKADGNKNASPKAANQAKISEALNRVQALVDKGSFDDAINVLKESLQSDPSNRNLNLTLAGLYHRLHQYDAEIQTYLDWSASAPGEALPHFEAAQAYATAGKSTEAMQQLTSFLDLTQQTNKQDMTVYPRVASIYRQLGMSADEGAVLQTWAQQAPNDIEVQRELASYYTRTGDMQSAISEYQAIAQSLPNDAEVHRNLANAYTRLNMNQEAEAELSTALNLQPQNMSTRLQLAYLYRQTQQLDAALQACTEIINAGANTPEGQQAQQLVSQIQAQRANTQSQR